MPVYNGELFIRQAIDSLLAQTFSKFELIISDNCSTDDTEAICREYASRDQRIRYFRHSENRGAIFNFNFVLEQARGEYFMWAAHDDLWDEHWIASLLENFEEGVAISFGHVVNIDENGMKVRNYPPFKFSGNRVSRLVRFYMAEDGKGKANLIYGIYKTEMVRKMAIEEYGKYSFAGDMLFVFDCLQYGDIRTDKSVYLYKRVRNDGARSHNFGTIVSSILLLNRLKNYISYASIATGCIEKTILILLFPIKYIFSCFLNVKYFVNKAFYQMLNR